MGLQPARKLDTVLAEIQGHELPQGFNDAVIHGHGHANTTGRLEGLISNACASQSVGVWLFHIYIYWS